MFSLFRKPAMVTAEDALPGRDAPIPTAEAHFVNGNPLKGPYPDGTEIAEFGMGCFWGPERVFWTKPGVWVTAVGYQGGPTPNPTYREVCSGRTGHTEVVRIVFDPARIAYGDLLRLFWRGTTPRRGCARATTSARSIARPSSATARTSAVWPSRAATPTRSG